MDGPVPVRVILLDTTNLDGNYQGSIGERQFRWLEERLIEAHAQYFDNEGSVVRTITPDRLVVLASHHGLDTMVNERQSPAGPEQDHPRVTGRCARGPAAQVRERRAVAKRPPAPERRAAPARQERSHERLLGSLDGSYG